MRLCSRRAVEGHYILTFIAIKLPIFHKAKQIIATSPPALLLHLPDFSTMSP